MAACRVPMVPREMTAAPCSEATEATAMESLGTSQPTSSVRDWLMADLRGC
jgi:hypothetical protein